MDEQRFDELSRLISTKTSRGQVLKILAGTVLGGLFVRNGTGEALASKGCGPNKQCAQWCASVFGEDTPAAEQCSSDAAHCTGLCYSCGPASGPGSSPSSICCTRNSGGYCTSYTGAACCSGGATCSNGTCVTCGTPGQPCCNPAPDIGAAFASGFNCTNDAGCQGTCLSTVAGGTVCFTGSYQCASCTSDAQCTASLGVPAVCVSTGIACSGTTATTCTPISACSCFTGTTLIAMADGTSRSIERVSEGDLVIGDDGQVNQVVEIERPTLGSRLLYALNNDDYFVTAEHPFMTAEGWKSIDPASLQAEGSDLRVDRLTVGDRLLSLAGVALPVGAGRPQSGDGVDVRTEAASLDCLLSRSADPMTALYNLRLDGNHTYFANGLLVHNK